MKKLISMTLVAFSLAFAGAAFADEAPAAAPAAGDSKPADGAKPGKHGKHGKHGKKGDKASGEKPAAAPAGDAK